MLFASADNVHNLIQFEQLRHEWWRYHFRATHNYKIQKYGILVVSLLANKSTSNIEVHTSVTILKFAGY